MRRTTIFGLAALPLAAFGGTLWLTDAVAPMGNSASIEMMQLLQDEHALMADYVKMDSEAKRRAYAAADQEAAALRVVALEQNRMRAAQAERLALAETEAKTERKSATVKTAIRIEPVALAQAAPAGEPLPLAQMANANAAVPRLEEGPVRSRMREFVSDVRRVPGWFASAANWMAESVPVPSLPNLPRFPGRQFRAEL